MELNQEQKNAAFYEDNAVVAAGAGSGKTMVLANRFAWLLTEKGLGIEKILTLTFTTKAAAQMYRRIHSLLKEISEKETGIRAERARLALDNFIHARIQTLDSYSTALVRQCAHRYGISPDFKIDQERCYELAHEEALPFLISHRRHPAIKRLYQDNRPSDIVRNIFSSVLFDYSQIDNERDFSADIKIQFDIVCNEWKNLSSELDIIINVLTANIFEDQKLLPDLVPVMESYKNNKIPIPVFSDIRSFFDLILQLPQEEYIEKAEEHYIQKTLSELLHFLSKINNISLRFGKKSDNPVKDGIKQLRSLFGKFSSLAVFCMQAGLILSIVTLLTELQHRYLTRKRAEGVLTFRDVANLARTILIEQEDIRQSEKEAFTAIMIDEFQDNNELQKDLLFLLAEHPNVITKGIPPAKNLASGKLFFVGDEKQSIYLFRGADVSVFRKLKDELKSAELSLKINYRSAPQLIGAFNAIFGGSNFDPLGKSPLHEKPSVFAPFASPVFEASYTPLEANEKCAGSLSVCILGKNSDSPDNNLGGKSDKRLSADENEALFTAEKIKKLLEEKNEDGGQKYQPGDIAILFRARSSQHFFEKHLRILGVPYSSEDINGFFYGGPVNDIMSVLRLAAYPLDSAAYAEMLRSPFAGISIPALAVCMAIFKISQNPEPFNNEPLSRLNKKDKEKYIHGQKIYSSICSMAENGSVSSLVSELWYRYGYCYETEWNPQTEVYSELYDYLFHLAVKADTANQGLAAFTDTIRSYRDSGERLTDIEIPLERPSAVHLLTIHKSKGLEFPVVFLCGCGKHSQTNSGGDVFFSNKTGIVFSPPIPSSCCTIPDMKNNFFWEQSIAEERLKRTAELRRLLYVGMTRAEKELYLTGSLTAKGLCDDKTKDFSLNLKKYTENKCSDNENEIPGDTILNNDTFFGLMLPSIAAHIAENSDANCPNSESLSFFNLEAIPAYTSENIKKSETEKSDLKEKKLNVYYKKIEAFYINAETIKTPVLIDNHLTPVSLCSTPAIDSEDILRGKGFFINREFSGETADDIFSRVDSMMTHFMDTGDDAGDKFNSGSFGTIAHICVEAILNGEKSEIPPKIACFLTPDEADIFLAAGNELAVRFMRSGLGKTAENALMRECEFSFRSIIKNKAGKEAFISGTVDLFFDDEESIHIVDFKTDGRETPSEYVPQMACYYRAIYSLFAVPAKKECRIWLYYLRTGHAVEITQRVKLFELEHRIFL